MVVSRQPSRTPRERRDSCRYPIDLPVEFQIWEGSALKTGYGRTVNLSTDGILFECDPPLVVGAQIEIQIIWPASTLPVRLFISGETVRTEANRCAVRIVRHALRPKPVTRC